MQSGSGRARWFRLWSAAAVAFAVAASGVASVARASEEAPSASPPLLKVGDDAPRFGPMLLHNPAAAGMRTFTLGDFVGDDASTPAKGVLLSFFASWCGPCKHELPLLVRLWNEYKSKGLEVVSISIDKTPEQFEKVRAIVAKDRITYPVVSDRFNLLARRYLGDTVALPAIFLVKPDGTIALVRQGYSEDASTFLDDAIDKLLGLAPGRASRARAEASPARK